MKIRCTIAEIKNTDDVATEEKNKVQNEGKDAQADDGKNPKENSNSEKPLKTVDEQKTLPTVDEKKTVPSNEESETKS